MVGATSKTCDGIIDEALDGVVVAPGVNGRNGVAVMNVAGASVGVPDIDGASGVVASVPVTIVGALVGAFAGAVPVSDGICKMDPTRRRVSFVMLFASRMI